MNNVNSSQLSGSKHKRQQGFTLLELMVVVAIMAALGGMVSYSGESRISDAKLTAAKAEMQSIRAALVAYKRDNFEFPDSSDGSDSLDKRERTSAADVYFLFSPESSTSLEGSSTIMSWDADYQRGWRGPYLVGGDTGLVDIGGDLIFTDGQYSGGGTVYTVVAGVLKFQRAIPDPFTAFPVVDGVENPNISNRCIENSENDNCLLDWRLLGGQGDSENNIPPYAPLSRLGRPYLFFNLNNRDKARIVSMGANGRYEGSSDGTESSCADFVPGGDDIIVCLY
jgi:prepilin-type N-terminal cleavage/methylation domain-containing protein